jgi:hypothetical protein
MEKQIKDELIAYCKRRIKEIAAEVEVGGYYQHIINLLEDKYKVKKEDE